MAEVEAGARGRAASGTGSGVFGINSDFSSLTISSPSEAISSSLSDPETSNASSSPPSEANSGEEGTGLSSWEGFAAVLFAAGATRSATEVPGAALEFRGTMVGG